MLPVSRTSLFWGRTAVLTLAATALLPAGTALAAHEVGTPTRLALASPAAGSGSLGGSSASAEDPDRVAVLSPMYDFFAFGTDIGMPLGCTLVGAYISDGADEIEQGGQAAPVVSALNENCGAAAEQGSAFVQTGREMSAPLAAINEYADPAIGQAADTMRQVGNDYGAVLSPMGPTIAGTGDTIDFFQSGSR